MPKLTFHPCKPFFVLLVFFASGVAGQPKITSFSPGNAPAGAAVVINGASFNPAPAGNIVYFGPVKAVVTAATPTSVTATVPAGAGYKPISVLNTATGLTAYSAQPFVPAFTNPAGQGIPANYFQSLTNFRAAYLPGNISVGDLDGDGKPDLLIGDQIDATKVLRNTSATGIIDASSLTRVTINDGFSGVVATLIIDMDGDGKPDLVRNTDFTNTVDILRNISNPGAIEVAAYPDNAVIAMNAITRALFASDLDGDGKPDLVTGFASSERISLLRNTATPGAINAASFAARVDFAVGLFPVAVSDVDGDGKPDIIATGPGGAITVLRNISTPGSLTAASFAPGVNIAANAVFAAFADVDGDGRPDLVTGGSDSIAVLRNTSSPGSITAAAFVQRTSFAINGQQLTIGDVDGDGKPDILGISTNVLSILRNTAAAGSLSAASFAKKVDFTINNEPHPSLAINDLDADGIPEILITNRDTYTVSVLKASQPQMPVQSLVPTVTLFSPASGPVGTPVTIKGTNFNATAANNIVYFGTVRAMVTSASATSLTVTAPAGAAYQPLSVLNTATGLTGYSRLPYITTFTTPFGTEIPPAFYQPKTTIGGFDFQSQFATGDLDGDGKPDIVVVSSFNHLLTVMRNVSAAGSIAPSFEPPVQLPALNVTGGVALKDVDGDGKPDIITCGMDNFQRVYMYVFRNTSVPGSLSASSFAQKVDFPANSTGIVLTGDMDNDGKPEIIISSSSSSSLTIYRNLSVPGSITGSSLIGDVKLELGYAISSLAIADLDGDGKQDIIAGGANLLSVYRNNFTTGMLNPLSFDLRTDFAASSGGQGSVAIGDIDGDGKPDLVSNGGSSGNVSVLRNTAVAGSITAASFATNVDFAAKQGGNLAIGDVNGDGKPDVVVANGNSKSFSVLNNASAPGTINAGSFVYRTDFIAGSNLSYIAPGDIDGDGTTEVLALTASGDFSTTISLFKIGTPPATAVPVVTGFSPASGPAGTVVTISGFNFDPLAANNTVYFGAVKAAVTGGNTHSLTVTVPAGATYQPVSVLNNANGLTAYAAAPFNTTFTNPYTNTIPANFYLPKTDLAAASLPYALAFGDIDGDGKPDMITVNANANTISVLRNISAAGSISAASFAAPVDFAVGDDPRAVAIGDIDGDGKLDITVANSHAASISVLRNTAAPGSITATSLAPRVDFATGQYPFAVAIGDLNGDGKPDLAVTNQLAGTVSVLRNTAVAGSINAASFANMVVFSAGYTQGLYPRSVAIGDLDGDGRPDLAIANERSGYVSVMLNSTTNPSAISFGELWGYATGGGSNNIAISDLNGDGKPDLAISNYGTNTISVLRNNFTNGIINANSFAETYNYSTGSQPFSLAIGDADGDGKPDLISVNSGASTISVLRNTYSPDHSTGYDHGFALADFIERTDFPTGGYPVSIAFGDLDGDGIAEIATANASPNSISILKLNPLRVPVITSFNPASGPAGTSVTINGYNFNSTPSKNIVYFGAVKAAVTGGTTTSLAVTVPAGATYRSISLLNTDVGLAGYSSRPFALTFPNPFGTGIPANFYRPKVDFAGGAVPYYVATGDLDGDGRPDMVVANSGANTISILRNTTTGGSITTASFAGKVDFAAPGDPRSIAIIDVDGDGKPDIVVAGAASTVISVLRNTSTPGSITAASFAPRVELVTGIYESSVALGDLDGDGRPDLVVSNLYLGTVSVMRNLSTPGSIAAASFAPRVDLATGAYPRFLAISDIDGDGKPDIVVANEKSNSVSVIRNVSVYGGLKTSSFEQAVNFAAGVNPPGLAAGDIDGDGRPDLVVVSYVSGTVSVLRNTSTAGSITAASFAAKVDYPAGLNPFFVIMGDADGDGKTDLVTANAEANTISVLRNTSTAGSITAASFAAKADFGTSLYPLSLAMGDLDGDGVAEIVAADANTNAVSVLKVNAPVAPGVLSNGRTAMDVQLYPNPTQGEFTLQLQGLGAAAADVEVFGENGKAIEKRVVNPGGKATRFTLELSVRNQPAGVYYVKVTSAAGVQIAKLVVQR